jgi:hypothetical protein
MAARALAAAGTIFNEILLWKLPGLPDSCVVGGAQAPAQLAAASAQLLQRLERLQAAVQALERQAPAHCGSGSGSGSGNGSGSSGDAAGSGGSSPAVGQFSCSTGGGQQEDAFSCQVAPQWRLLGHEGSVHR